LSVFVVILSEAKDPDKLHPSIPLEPFNPHLQIVACPPSPAILLSSPETPETYARQAQSRGARVLLYPLH
jgi:hypothetical protein